MTLKRQIEKKNSHISLDHNREKFIRAGAMVTSDAKKDDKWTNINLRIKTDALQQIDDIVENSMGISRSGWILQTIEAKLKETQKGTKNE